MVLNLSAPIRLTVLLWACPPGSVRFRFRPPGSTRPTERISESAPPHGASRSSLQLHQDAGGLRRICTGECRAQGKHACSCDRGAVQPPFKYLAHPKFRKVRRQVGCLTWHGRIVIQQDELCTPLRPCLPLAEIFVLDVLCALLQKPQLRAHYGFRCVRKVSDRSFACLLKWQEKSNPAL